MHPTSQSHAFGERIFSQLTLYYKPMPAYRRTLPFSMNRRPSTSNGGDGIFDSSAGNDRNSSHRVTSTTAFAPVIASSMLAAYRIFSPSTFRAASVAIGSYAVTIAPAARRSFTIGIDGDSRMSSVPGLN